MSAAYTKVTLSYGPLPSEVLDVYLPAGAAAPTPACFMIHGGAWISGSRAQFEPGSGYATQNTAVWLAEHGVAAVCLDYPLHNWQTGAGSMGAIIQAAERAVAFVKADASLNIDPARTAAWGMSAGGEIASYLGAKGVVGAVIADSAPEDLSTIATLRNVIDQMMPTAWDQRYWSPADNLGAASAKDWFLAGGTADATVSLTQQTEAFAGTLAARGLNVELSLYGGGHVFGGASPSATQSVVGAQEQWLVQMMASFGAPAGGAATAVADFHPEPVRAVLARTS